VHPNEQDAEFVAAEPSEHVVPLQGAADDVAHLPKQLVAGLVTAGVVDHLELVEIQVGQSGHLVARRRRRRGTRAESRSNSTRFISPVRPS
jgi:hypothetical protein